MLQLMKTAPMLALTPRLNVNEQEPDVRHLSSLSLALPVCNWSFGFTMLMSVAHMSHICSDDTYLIFLLSIFIEIILPDIMLHESEKK